MSKTIETLRKSIKRMTENVVTGATVAKLTITNINVHNGKRFFNFNAIDSFNLGRITHLMSKYDSPSDFLAKASEDELKAVANCSLSMSVPLDWNSYENHSISDVVSVTVEVDKFEGQSYDENFKAIKGQTETISAPRVKRIKAIKPETLASAGLFDAVEVEESQETSDADEVAKELAKA